MKKRSIWELVGLALLVAVTLGILGRGYFVTAGWSESSALVLLVLLVRLTGSGLHGP